MKLKIVPGDTGKAAAIKMIRSVMIKGLEALTLECYLAASRAGLLDEVLVSMKNNYPTLDLAQMGDYNIERMASHGERRAAEMEESAVTLRELGLEPLMVEATVKRQREMGALGKHDGVRATLNDGRAAMLERRSATPPKKGTDEHRSIRKRAASWAARLSVSAPALTSCAAGSGSAPRAAPWSAACRGTSA